MVNRKIPAENVAELLLANAETEPGSLTVEAQVLAEFNQADDQDKWTVTVARLVKYGEPEQFCFECVPTDFPIVAKIQEQFGAGMYVVRARRNGVIVRCFRYAIAEPKVRPVDTVKTELGAVAAAFTAALERQGQQIERLMERVNERPASAGNSEKLSDLVAAMVSVRDLISPPQAATNPMATAFEMFKLGIEAANNREPPEQSGGLLGFAERMINSPIIKQMIESASAAPAPTLTAPQPSRPGIAAPQPGAEGDATRQLQQQAPEQTAQIENFMRQQILYLMGRAHQWTVSAMKKSHPDLYAEWVLDNIPLELLQPILDLPDPVAALATYVPEAKTHAPWFAMLLESVRQELTGDGEGDDNEPQPNGSAGTPSHVSSPARPGSSVHP